jgi:hypothetical protein
MQSLVATSGGRAGNAAIESGRDRVRLDVALGHSGVPEAGETPGGSAKARVACAGSRSRRPLVRRSASATAGSGSLSNNARRRDRACRRQRCTLPCMIPWIIMAVVAVPLVVIAFIAMRRKTPASELPADDDEQAREEQEFAEAEAYEAKWLEEDKERSRQERYP